MVNQARILSRAKWRVRACAGLLLVLLPATLPASTRMAEARRHYEAQRYEQVLEVLGARISRGSDQGMDSPRLLLIGKAYGRLAEAAPWYRAVRLAVHCREYLERAVAADPDNADAVQALARFLEQAPALVGGDAERAMTLRKQLENRQRSS